MSMMKDEVVEMNEMEMSKNEMGRRVNRSE